MPIVTLKPASDLMPQVQSLLARVLAELKRLLPWSEIEHIGATAVPGSITKGDVDVLVRVSPTAFQTSADILKAHFSIKQPSNWTQGFASFGDDVGYDFPLGIQLVAKNSENDFLIYLRDYLISNPDFLSEYNQLKIRHADEGPDAYWKAKDSFFTKILASRRKC